VLKSVKKTTLKKCHFSEKKALKTSKILNKKTTLKIRKFGKKGTKKRHYSEKKGTKKRHYLAKKGTILAIFAKKSPKKGTLRTEKVVLRVPFFGFLQILQKISKNDRKKSPVFDDFRLKTSSHHRLNA
jgi:hypothetical protein